MPSSNCPEGSQNEAILVPFAVLLILDAIMIAILVFLLLRANWVKSKKGPRHLLGRPLRLSDIRERKAGYETLDDPEAIALEPNLRPIRREPTGFQAALDQQYLEDSNDGGLDHDGNIELKQFVASMSKAIQGSSFGLAIDYHQLSFHPRGSSKPILSEVSGNISGGSLVGVMGGSGAGKCESHLPSFVADLDLTCLATFVNVLMGRTANTGGVVKVNGVASRMKQ